MFARVRRYSGIELAPGESRETELKLQTLRLAGPQGRDLKPYPDPRYGDCWLDVAARLRYRRSDRFLADTSI